MRIVRADTGTPVPAGTAVTDIQGREWTVTGISCGPDDYTHPDGVFPGRVFVDGNGLTGAEMFPGELLLAIVD